MRPRADDPKRRGGGLGGAGIAAITTSQRRQYGWIKVTVGKKP